MNRLNLLTMLLVALWLTAAGGLEKSWAQCGSGQCAPSRWLPTGEPQTGVSIPEAIRLAVGRVRHRSSEGTLLGSGVLIEVNSAVAHVLTCSHVLGSQPGRTEVQFLDMPAVEATVVARDTTHDLALLRLARPINRRALTLGRLPQQARLFAYGYGGGTRLRGLAGTILGIATAQGARHPSVRINTAVESGDSGGPVLDAQDRVVAIVWGVQGRVTYAMFGAPIERLLATARPLSEPNSPNRTPSTTPLESPDRFREITNRLVEVEKRVSQQATAQQQWRQTFKPCDCDGDHLTQQDLESFVRRDELNRFVTRDQFAASEAKHDREHKRLHQKWSQEQDTWREDLGQPRPAPSPDQERGWAAIAAWQILLGAVGVSSPIGVALVAGKWIAHRRVRRRRKQADTNQKTVTTNDGLGGPSNDRFPDIPDEAADAGK